MTEKPFNFSPEQVERYSRQILLKEVGGIGQRKLLNATACVVGAGGLGSPALLYLAGAGVGRIRVIDSDSVDLSNLQRQVIFRQVDVGRPKAVRAQEAVNALNADCEVEQVAERLTLSNVRELLRGCDVVLDGSDNFPTRFLVSDTCWLERIPLVSAAVLRFEGQLMTILPGTGNPCYRCLVPEPPPPGQIPSCQEAGVLGAVVGVMGCLQAAEAIKLILEIGESLSHHLLLYDSLRGEFRRLKRAPHPSCPLCGPEASIKEPIEYDFSCEMAPVDDTDAD